MATTTFSGPVVSNNGFSGNINGNTVIGTDAASTLGFYGDAGTAQATTSITGGAFVANTSGISNDTATFDGYTIGQIVAALRAVGLLA